MAVARIQIDLSLLPGEKLADLLHLVGDIVIPLLDPHEDGEPCVRYVSVEAFQFDDEQPHISFIPDEDEEELIGIGVPQIFRDNFENN